MQQPFDGTAAAAAAATSTNSWTCADALRSGGSDDDRRGRHGPPASVPRLFLFGPTTLATSVFAPGATSSGGEGVAHPGDLIGSPTRAGPQQQRSRGSEGTHHAPQGLQRQRLATPAELAALAKPEEVFNLPTPDAGGLNGGGATDAAPAPPALHRLAAIYGRQLGPALRLAMRAQTEVAVLFSTTSRRTVYRVSGHPCIGMHFCTCSAFKYVVCNKGEAEHCKHQLALLLLHRFGFGSVGGLTKHAFPLHRTIPPELDERISFMREVRAVQQQHQQQRNSGSRSSSQIAAAAGSSHAAMSPLAPEPASAPSPDGGPPAIVTGRTGSNASPFQLGPGGSSTSTAQIAASAVAAAAAPITFTDADGISWIEVPEAELASIFVG